MFEQDGVGGPVAGKDLVRGKGFDLFFGHAPGSKFRLGLVQGFAAHQCLGLGEEIGQEFFVVIAAGIQGTGRGQEIAGNHGRPLVQELVKGMLSIGAWFSPDDGTGLTGDLFAFTRHGFAVTLHVSLLEIGGEAFQILVIGKDGVALGTHEIPVPDAEQSHDHRDIVHQSGGPEMFIDLVRPLEQFLEPVHADAQGYGQPDGRPQGIPPPDPVPEPEHVLGIDAECLDSVPVGGHGHEMSGNGSLVPGMIQKPGPGGPGVGHGLLSGEGL